MDKNRTDFSTMVSVQPFWDAEKSHKSLLTEGNNSTPIAVVHELKNPGKPFWDAEKSHKSLFWPKEITAHPLRLCMS